MASLPLTLTARQPQPEGLGVAGELSPPPGELLLSGSRLVLLIHGYNNTHEEAEDSYLRFRVATGFDHGCPAGEICFFHWPGNHRWSVVSALSYPIEIMPAKESARRLHDYLVQLALKRPGGWPLELSLICHSLGNRLALEMLRLFANEPPNPNLRIVNCCLMAAAVPVFMMDSGGGLRGGIGLAQNSLVLHSRSDWVLHYVFPLGQTVAVSDEDEGFFPEAVGHRGRPSSAWTDPPYDMGTFDYLHGDYWSGKTNGESTTAVATFLGSARARQLAQAVTPTRPMPEPAALPERKVGLRALPATA